jgi:hypothetical protein
MSPPHDVGYAGVYVVAREERGALPYHSSIFLSPFPIPASGCAAAMYDIFTLTIRT